MPALNTLATESYDGATTYSDVVRFIHLYVIEPHPQSPEISPYNGQVWEGDYSTKPQPLTYEERVEFAREIVPELEGDQLMLVDDLTPMARSNPVWCSYGPAPNSAYLVGQDGVLHTVQEWVDTADMQLAIDDLLR